MPSNLKLISKGEKNVSGGASPPLLHACVRFKPEPSPESVQ